MNAPSVMPSETLPILIDRATASLEAARNSAEVLEARDMARVAYDAAKSAGRMARAKGAHDEMQVVVYRMQADAALIEARAKIRLVDEYDAAQERGEVGVSGQRNDLVPNGNEVPSAADIGLTRKDIHEARKIRDAEKADPGLAARALDAMVDACQEPTRAALRRSVLAAVDDAASRPRREKNPLHKIDAARDRVFAFSGLCRSLAEYADVEQIAAWSAIPQTAERLPTDVRNAMLILSRFLEAHNA
jgi:hypothetical protein